MGLFMETSGTSKGFDKYVIVSGAKRRVPDSLSAFCRWDFLFRHREAEKASQNLLVH